MKKHLHYLDESCVFKLLRFSSRKAWLLTAFCCLFYVNIHAQENTRVVSGAVSSEDSGEPLLGVTVTLKGTTNAIQTDIEGNYRIQVSGADERLVFAYVGYISQELAVGSSNELNIQLVPDYQMLDDIVVVGYGTQRKKDVTGSIASISVEDIKNQPLSNVESLMQGRAAGVQITQSSGAPGSNLNIRIRGGSSLNAGNEPLYVIDGIPIYNSNSDPSGTSYNTFPSTNALASLNTNDIESIQILKDASATSIYGSRANNGVVIITTKKGTGERATINYSAYYGIQETAKKLKLMDGAQHAEFLNDWAKENEITKPFDNPASIGKGTDWQSEIMRTAPIQNHQLSVSSAKNSIKYYVSANYFDQEGIILNSGLKRYAFRVNLDGDITDKMRFNQSLTYNRTITNSLPGANSGAGNIRSAAERSWVSSPTVSVFDADGNYTKSWFGASKPDNPIEAISTTFNELIGDNLLGNISVSYDIVPGLTFKTLAGVNIMNRGLGEFYPGSTTYLGSLFNGLGIQSTKRMTNLLNENTLRYVGEFNSVHKIEALGGFTVQTERQEGFAAQSSNFPEERLGLHGAGSAIGIPIVTSDYSFWSLASFLGRVNYSFKDKLLFTGTFRADGSSRFGSGNKWGYFPSVALGYRLSEEEFLKDIDFISELKIRGSYGLTGNQEIGSYQSLPRLSSGINYIFDNALVAGVRQSTLANSALKWERAGQFDIGLELGVFQNRLSFVADYYNKTTYDLLFQISLPGNSGYSSALYNTGSVENKGIELSLDAQLLTNQFKWDASINYARNRNKITSLGRTSSTTLFVGYPPGMVQGYVSDGIFRSQTEVDQQSIQKGVEPGDLRYKDVNNDGEINTDDRILIGNPFPDYIFGLNNNFEYKNLSLSIFLQGSIGGQSNRLDALFNPADVTSNKSIDLIHRWTPEHTDTDVPRAGVSNWLSPSTGNLQDLSYMKIRNIQLGYKIPTERVSFLSSADVFVAGQNLVTFAKNYTGYDPDGGINYPTAKTITFGVNFNF